MGLYSSWLLINNGLLICYGWVHEPTSAGSSLGKVVNYPISFSTKVSSVIVTPVRYDTKWLYDFWYCYAVFKGVVNCFHINLHGLNSGQYIDGFSWFAIGY